MVSSGAGTEIDPYIIENYIINGTYSSTTTININSVNIFLTMRNCTIIRGRMELSYCSNLEIYNNTFIDCISTPISASHSSNMRIENNIISGATDDSGISLYDSDSNDIVNNIITGFSFGVSLSKSHSNNISLNSIKYCTVYGIYLLNSHRNIISDNNFQNTLDFDIHLSNSYDNILKGNSVSISRDPYQNMVYVALVCIICILGLLLKNIKQFKEYIKTTVFSKRNSIGMIITCTIGYFISLSYVQRQTRDFFIFKDILIMIPFFICLHILIEKYLAYKKKKKSQDPSKTSGKSGKSRKSRKERKLLEQFKKVMSFSQSIDISRAAKMLDISEDKFYKKLLIWSDNISFVLRDNKIIIENLDKFMDDLDVQFSQWEENEETKSGKLA